MCHRKVNSVCVASREKSAIYRVLSTSSASSYDGEVREKFVFYAIQGILRHTSFNRESVGGNQHTPKRW